MAANLTARTNQKILHTRLALSALSTAEEQGDKAAVDVACEAVIFHFNLAYVAFLREIAVAYRLNPELISSRDELAVALAEAETACGELTELQQLIELRQWPAHLEAAYQHCWRLDADSADTAKAATQHEGHAEQINLLNVAEPELGQQPSAMQLQAWLVEFQQLVQRQREALLEW